MTDSDGGRGRKSVGTGCLGANTAPVVDGRMPCLGQRQEPGAAGGYYNGKMDGPRLARGAVGGRDDGAGRRGPARRLVPELVAAWDFALDIALGP